MSTVSGKIKSAMWSVATVAVAAVLFSVGLSKFNQDKNTVFLSIPFAGLLAWLAAVSALSSARQRREPIVGALVGVGLVVAIVGMLILYSASAHY
jgi:hypothetical protein